MTIRVSVRGAREAADRLKITQRNLGNTVPLMKRLAVLLDQWVQRNFKAEGALGTKWVPLKAGGRWVGKKGNRRFDPTAKILQDTGRLRISFAPGHSKFSAWIGSELDYSEPHEKGKGKLPVRKMLPEAHQVKEPVTRVIKDHVRKGVRHAQGK